MGPLCEVNNGKRLSVVWCFFFQAEDGIRDVAVTGVQTCALPISLLPSCRGRAQAVQGTADLRDMVRRMMPVVAQSTGLPFKREPLVLRRTRDQVRDYVIHKFDEDLPPADLAGLQSALRLFGMIPDSLALRATMIDLLVEQIAGYYD